MWCEWGWDGGGEGEEYIIMFLSPPGMQLPAENGPGRMRAGRYIVQFHHLMEFCSLSVLMGRNFPSLPPLFSPPPPPPQKHIDGELSPLVHSEEHQEKYLKKLHDLYGK